MTGIRRASELGDTTASTVATGWTALDAELAGGSWPTRSLVEILQPQPTEVEWRLIGTELRTQAGRGREVVAIEPPKHLHPPGLASAGNDPVRFVWPKAVTPAA